MFRETLQEKRWKSFKTLEPLFLALKQDKALCQIVVAVVRQLDDVKAYDGSWLAPTWHLLNQLFGWNLQPIQNCKRFFRCSQEAVVLTSQKFHLSFKLYSALSFFQVLGSLCGWMDSLQMVSGSFYERR